MFKNNRDSEADFCESYKSQILNSSSEEKESSFNTILKVITIIILLTIIIAVSIYGYNYFVNKKGIEPNMPPTSIQISDDDLKVTEEEKSELKVESISPETKVAESNIDKIANEEESELKVESISPETKVAESDIDKIANDVKLAIAQSEEIEDNNSKDKVVAEEKSLEVPVTTSDEAKYLEDLADLSKEIDKERK